MFGAMQQAVVTTKQMSQSKSRCDFLFKFLHLATRIQLLLTQLLQVDPMYSIESMTCVPNASNASRSDTGP